MNTKNQNRIDAYLFGKQKPAERAAFEAEMEQDEQLKADVELLRTEHRAMELMVQKDLASQLKQWSQEAQELEHQAPVIPLQRRFIGRRVLAIAASIVLLVGFLGQMWVFNNYSGKALSDNSFAQTATNPNEVRGPKGTPLPQQLQLGLQALKDGDPSQAIQHFDQVQDATFADLAQIMKGEQLYQQEDYPAAIEVFRNLIDNANTALYKEKAEWLLLLCLHASQTNEVEKLELLEKIAGDEAHYYHSAGKDLKERLGSFWGRVLN